MPVLGRSGAGEAAIGPEIREKVFNKIDEYDTCINFDMHREVSKHRLGSWFFTRQGVRPCFLFHVLQRKIWGTEGLVQFVLTRGELVSSISSFKTLHYCASTYCGSTLILIFRMMLVILEAP